MDRGLLLARTLQSLDWPLVLGAVSRSARTVRGRAEALGLPLVDTPAAARALYASVGELMALELAGERVPVAGVTDLREHLDRAQRGVVLEGHELREAGACLHAVDALARWLLARSGRLGATWSVAERVRADPELLSRLTSSFDDRGELSAVTYPELGALREEVKSLHQRIQRTLERLVRGDELGEVLQDRFVTTRGDRYVLPVRATFKRAGLGIVHDTSASGETVFVEPTEVVELNNQLKVVEASLKREERRILAALSGLLGRLAPQVCDALDAATVLDLRVARADLGLQLRGVLPRVGEEGVVVVRRARHPVLVLHPPPGGDVVPNDLSLGPQNPGLVISGPNTGGKTVALKLLGLLTLFVRAGLPLPCADDARVDLFPHVVADIGDAQGVEEGLSTFSGQVRVLNAILQDAGPGSLVLLDEIAVGTDPAQGAALARAVLEALVGAGARVVATTHYTPLKALPAADPRFRSAAVEYADGRPTFRLTADAAGSSHALSVAERLGLPRAVLQRARDVLDAGERDVADLVARLEVEREGVRARGEALDREKEGLQLLLADLQQREGRLRDRQRRLEEAALGATREHLRQAEAEVRGLVAALQRDPDLRAAGRALERVRELGRGLEGAPLAAPAPEEGPPEVVEGQRVKVRRLGAEGVVAGPVRGGQVEVQVGGLRTRVAVAELEPVTGGRQARRARERSDARPTAPAMVRTGANTVDLRGMRLDDATRAVEQQVDTALLQGDGVVFLLHGHGTGRLKDGLRTWLARTPGVRSWRAAAEEEGGDAFTVVVVG